MIHAAIGVFQADADWNISVRVAGMPSKEMAERYANSFRIRMIDSKLYRDHGDGISHEDKPWIEVADSEVSLSRLKSEARNRIVKAHRRYADQGLDPALESIRDFDRTGRNDLVISEDDFEPINLPIARWHEEAGLMCGFGSLSYGVE